MFAWIQYLVTDNSCILVTFMKCYLQPILTQEIRECETAKCSNIGWRFLYGAGRLAADWDLAIHAGNGNFKQTST